MQVIFVILMLIFVCGCSYLAGYLHRKMSRVDFMSDIVDFHKKFELSYSGGARVLPADLAEFRMKFELEELNEYVQVEQELRQFIENGLIPAIRKDGKIDLLLELQLDALVDLTYVTLGHAYLQFGPSNFREAWRRVHEANMAKVRKIRAGDGHTDSGRLAAYDVVKPAGWVAPSHLDLIQRRHV